MIGYVTLGTNDLEQARAFYDSLLGASGAKRLMQLEHGFTLYGTRMDRPMLAVTPPYNKEPARPGNGSMVALQMKTREEVDAIHAKALELGGTCEGAPGLRAPEEMGFYGAYFRDLDGNKLCAFRTGPA
jgi:catechol 2,3-dioxygenase-like lactoylglutathione lyase family enzyme